MCRKSSKERGCYQGLKKRRKENGILGLLQTCHKYFDNTYLVQGACGLKLCKGYWLEYDYVCPISESNLNGEEDAQQVKPDSSKE